jgi:hypothetical protein
MTLLECVWHLAPIDLALLHAEVHVWHAALRLCETERLVWILSTFALFQKQSRLPNATFLCKIRMERRRFLSM